MLNPSRVEVPAPAPVMLIPTYIDLARAKPPDIITPAAVVVVASVVLEKVATPEAVKLPVNVPDNAPPLIVGEVKVLLVNVSEPANVARVPVVGRVTEVLAVVVTPSVCAPVCVKLPPRVSVLPVFATPVPPYSPATTPPCQVPVPIVPRVVIEV